MGLGSVVTLQSLRWGLGLGLGLGLGFGVRTDLEPLGRHVTSAGGELEKAGARLLVLGSGLGIGLGLGLGLGLELGLGLG